MKSVHPAILLLVLLAAAQVLQVQDLTTLQIAALDRGKTAVILPGGILEEHGPYLPAFTDGYLSQRLTADLARAIAKRSGFESVLIFYRPLQDGVAIERVFDAKETTNVFSSDAGTNSGHRSLLGVPGVCRVHFAARDGREDVLA
jgi:hypothetical protein